MEASLKSVNFGGQRIVVKVPRIYLSVLLCEHRQSRQTQPKQHALVEHQSMPSLVSLLNREYGHRLGLQFQSQLAALSFR